VSILSDALRGTRETPKASCASLLAPLVEEFGEDRVTIRMYHTPNFTGIKKKIVPNRLNEGWGLQHMKLYGVDDEIIMSGYAILGIPTRSINGLTNSAKGQSLHGLLHQSSG
jgi:CDP-diacylglycerol--glycerol-3-phosphate 3-phosphatidyltransferase